MISSCFTDIEQHRPYAYLAKTFGIKNQLKGEDAEHQGYGKGISDSLDRRKTGAGMKTQE